MKMRWLKDCLRNILNQPSISGTPTRSCIESKTDFSSTYHFLFIENTSDRGTCYHCVKIFVRTVNIIEKIESEHIINRYETPRSPPQLKLYF